MFRRYEISIKIKEGVMGYRKDILKVFGCSITEPSNWVEYGSTKERGLTFLDQEGKELDSIVFEHQPYFNSLEEKTTSEKNEIKELIYEALLRHYQLAPADVIITVTEYSS